MKSFYKKSALTLAILSASFSYSAVADDVNAVEINVPAQPLATAIKVFSQQSGLQIGYDTNLARGLNSKGITNSTNLEAALEGLLNGTGLTYEFVNDKTVIIKAVDDAADSQDATSDQEADEEVVVTGSRLRSVAPTSQVEVITRDDFKKLDRKSVV